jgi:Ca2+-binding RTX toxin-like protein
MSKLGGTNARPAADPIQPSDPDFTLLFRADAAAPQPQEAPPVANDDAYTTNDATTIVGNLLTNDTPGDVPLAVTAVNGAALAVDREIILPSGARLRVNSDGSFTYNPNGAFNGVPTTNDVFSYTVAGGDTASVTVTVQDPANPNIGTDNPETLTGTPGDDVMDARGGDDIVNALGGNDSIDGGTGADQMNGSTGNDLYFVDNAGDTVTELDGEGYDIIIASVNYTLGAGVYVEELTAPASRTLAITLTGNDLNNIIRGARGNDTLNGGIGNDLLDGGFGRDTMVGGIGDDVYYASNSGNFYDLITEAAGEGYDIAYVVAGLGGDTAYILNAGAHVELLAPLIATIGASITGNELDQELRGSLVNDTLRGMGGADLMTGYTGNDIYFIDLQDTIVEQANEGIDAVNVTFDYTLMANFEDLSATLAPAAVSLVGNSVDNTIYGSGFGDIILGGTGNDTIYGDALSGPQGNDSLYGEAGNDRLDGLGGSDLMVGALGNDIYVVRQAGDVVVEDVNEAGQTLYSGDEVQTYINYTLAPDQYIEILSASAQSLTLTGNDLAQRITALYGNNLIFGKGGDDILSCFFGGGTTDGGFGDDIHFVDGADDIVVERVGEGRDTVYASANYVLAAAAEVEALSTVTLGATNSINLTGNGFTQEIYGNAGANTLTGGGGADYIAGFGGDDTYLISSGTETLAETLNNGRDVVYTAFSYTLAAGTSIEVLSTDSILGTSAINLTGNSFAQEIYGNNGANRLNGGGGADYLVGFGGDDIYLIFNGNEVVVENAGGGRDVVYTTVSYALAAGTYVEALSTDSIAGTNAINLTGNELNNEIYGNNGANLLNGGGGAGDYLVGWGGDDTYLVFTGGEIVIENAGGGRDVVYSSISYTLAAGSFVEVLSTNSIAGTGGISLTGNELAQEVYGNNGANTLNGGAGGDYLVGFGGADNFAFTTALGGGNVDHLADFSAVDDTILLENAVFTGLPNGALAPSAFVAGSAAADADDRIVYNSATGQIFFDADGNGAGAQILFATVNAGTILTASDFMVI